MMFLWMSQCHLAPQWCLIHPPPLVSVTCIQTTGTLLINILVHTQDLSSPQAQEAQMTEVGENC